MFEYINLKDVWSISIISGDNWKIASKNITKTALSKLLDSFKLTNAELSSKKNVDGLKDANAAIKVSK